jgi:hypothetical protein
VRSPQEPARVLVPEVVPLKTPPVGGIVMAESHAVPVGRDVVVILVVGVLLVLLKLLVVEDVVVVGC